MSNQKSKLKAIADAIRVKDKTTDKIKGNDFPERILAIPTESSDPALLDPLIPFIVFVDYEGTELKKIRTKNWDGIIPIPDRTDDGLTFIGYNCDTSVLDNPDPTMIYVFCALYETTSGCTELIADLTNDYSRIVSFNIVPENINESTFYEVDWDDGSVDTITNLDSNDPYVFSHNYDYISNPALKVKPKITIRSNSHYTILDINGIDNSNKLTSIRCGNNLIGALTNFNTFLAAIESIVLIKTLRFPEENLVDLFSNIKGVSIPTFTYSSHYDYYIRDLFCNYLSIGVIDDWDVKIYNANSAYFYFPSIKSFTNNMISYNSNIKILDLHFATNIQSYSIKNNLRLKEIILRSNILVDLEGILVLQNYDEMIINGIYVPDNLIEDYKVATNWSIYANLFKPISSLPQ